LRELSLALPVAALIAFAAGSPLEAQLPAATVPAPAPAPTACAAERFPLDTTSFVMAMGRGAHGHWRLGRTPSAAPALPPAAPGRDIARR